MMFSGIKLWLFGIAAAVVLTALGIFIWQYNSNLRKIEELQQQTISQALTIAGQEINIAILTAQSALMNELLTDLNETASAASARIVQLQDRLARRSLAGNSEASEIVNREWADAQECIVVASGGTVGEQANETNVVCGDYLDGKRGINGLREGYDQ